MKATDLDFTAFGAYQHFLYYINVKHLKENSPWDQHLTDHFIEKLLGSLTTFIQVGDVVRWVQEMSQDNQRNLLGYIIEHHSNKW